MCHLLQRLCLACSAPTASVPDFVLSFVLSAHMPLHDFSMQDTLFGGKPFTEFHGEIQQQQQQKLGQLCRINHRPVGI